MGGGINSMRDATGGSLGMYVIMTILMTVT